MEIIQIIYLKIKLSTTILPLGHFTDPHPLYCRWFAERRVSLNKNPHVVHYSVVMCGLVGDVNLRRRHRGRTGGVFVHSGGRLPLPVCA